MAKSNASVPSGDNRLIEAVLLTTDTEAVASARQFVRGLCLNQLTPKQVAKLKKIYRPPHFPGGGGRGRRKLKKPSVALPILPTLKLAQLELVDWTAQEQDVHEAGIKIAKKRRQRKRDYIIDSFPVNGKCQYEVRDKLIQITDEGKNGTYVTPPGNVLYIRRYRTPRAKGSFVFVERPTHQDRRNVKRLMKRLGKGSAKLLKRDGLVQNRAFAQNLLRILS